MARIQGHRNRQMSRREGSASSTKGLSLLCHTVVGGICFHSRTLRPYSVYGSYNVMLRAMVHQWLEYRVTEIDRCQGENVTATLKDCQFVSGWGEGKRR